MGVMIYTEENKLDQLEEQIRALDQTTRAKIAEEEQKAKKESKPFCLRCANEDLVNGLTEIKQRIERATIQGTPLTDAIKISLDMDYDSYTKMKLISVTPYTETKLVTTSKGEVVKAKIPTSYFEHYACDRGHVPMKLELDPEEYKRKNKVKQEEVYEDIVETESVKKGKK